MASARVTIMIDKALEKRIREIQSKRIKDENKSVSFSTVINDLLGKSLKIKIQ